MFFNTALTFLVYNETKEMSLRQPRYISNHRSGKWKGLG